MILDTSFLIDLFDGHTQAFEKGVELSAADTIQRIPSPVVMELWRACSHGQRR
jgi:predicted nucleic acid-binding protein